MSHKKSDGCKERIKVEDRSKERIVIRTIDREHRKDINIPNEPFKIFGRMLPSYEGGVWRYQTQQLPPSDQREECFPEENYDFDQLAGNSIFLGAYDGQRCIGLAILQHALQRYLYLYDLKVNQEYRGQGVASKLMDEAKRVSKTLGYRGVYTQGQDNNLGACLFYLRAGFEIGGYDTRLYTGTSLEGVGDVFFYIDHS